MVSIPWFKACPISHVGEVAPSLFLYVEDPTWTLSNGKGSVATGSAANQSALGGEIVATPPPPPGASVMAGQRVLHRTILGKQHLERSFGAFWGLKVVGSSPDKALVLGKSAPRTELGGSK